MQEKLSVFTALSLCRNVNVHGDALGCWAREKRGHAKCASLVANRGWHGRETDRRLDHAKHAGPRRSTGQETAALRSALHLSSPLWRHRHVPAPGSVCEGRTLNPLAGIVRIRFTHSRVRRATASASSSFARARSCSHAHSPELLWSCYCRGEALQSCLVLIALKHTHIGRPGGPAIVLSCSLVAHRSPGGEQMLFQGRSRQSWVCEGGAECDKVRKCTSLRRVAVAFLWRRKLMLDRSFIPPRAQRRQAPLPGGYSGKKTGADGADLRGRLRFDSQRCNAALENSVHLTSWREALLA